MSGPDLELPADDRALEELLRARRRGPPAPHESTPWDFARNWDSQTLRSRVWPIVSRLLVDADELVRLRAVELVRVWDAGADLTAPRLIEVATKHPELYGDQAPEGTTLRHELAFALSNRARPENAAQVAALLRDMSEHEVLETAALLIGRHDPDFVIDRTTVWGEAQARWFADAAGSIAMFRRDALLPALQAFRGFGEAAKQRILEQVERYIQRDDGAATSLAVGEQLAAPEMRPIWEELRTLLATIKENAEKAAQAKIEKDAAKAAEDAARPPR